MIELNIKTPSQFAMEIEKIVQEKSLPDTPFVMMSVCVTGKSGHPP